MAEAVADTDANADVEAMVRDAAESWTADARDKLDITEEVEAVEGVRG